MVVDLQAMAKAPIGADLESLPQVHALNCLKDIFTDSRFGPSSEIYIADTLDIAASCLESQLYDRLEYLHGYTMISDTFSDGIYATVV